MNREELAWAAGFFDGEGTIYSVKVRYPTLEVSQAGPDAPEILERFASALGLEAKIETRTPIVNRKQQYRYKIYGFSQVQLVTARLWPWLSKPKREQAVRALAQSNGRFTDLCEFGCHWAILTAPCVHSGSLTLT